MKYNSCWTKNKGDSQKLIKKGNICIAGARERKEKKRKKNRKKSSEAKS